jgi:hypothetical protein
VAREGKRNIRVGGKEELKRERKELWGWLFGVMV